MPKVSLKPTSELHHGWYMAEWCEHLEWSQADAVRALGWARSTASGLWSGTQPYNQQRVDEVAQWLKVEPFELLMPPSEALNLRRLRETAYSIAAESSRTLQLDPPTSRKSLSKMKAPSR